MLTGAGRQTLGLHPGLSSHLHTGAGGGFSWHKSNGWKVHFSPELCTAGSDHRSAPSQLPDRLPFCSSPFGLRKEREGSTKPSTAPIDPR